MDFPEVHRIAIGSGGTAWRVYLVAGSQDLDDPTDTGGTELQLLADCRYSHGVYVEALKNAVPVLDSEFVHGPHFMDAARFRQT